MKKLTSILFVFSAILCYGQVSLLAGTEEKEFFVNKKFTVTFVLEINGENLVQESRLRMPDFSKFEIVGNASDQNTVVLDRGVVNQQVVQWILIPKSSGRMKIGSALVTINGKIYKTEPFDIVVKEGDSRANVMEVPVEDPIYLNVEVEDKEVYQNQPTLAVLKAYSRNYNNLRKVKNIQLPNQSDVFVRPVSYSKSEIEPLGEMSSQVLAVFMVFPRTSGKIELDPVSANVSNKNLKIISNKVKLTVKKLPINSPTGFTDAVGNFTIDINSTTKPEDLEVEKAIDVYVKLSGNGNFSDLHVPKLKNSEDYQFFPPKISSKVLTSQQGMKGDVIAHYVVVPRKAGPLTISTEHFSYFDPKATDYVDMGSKSLNVHIYSHEEIAASRTPLERVNDYTNNVLETVDSPVLETKNLKLKEKDAVNWNALWINSSILGLLFLFIFGYNHYQKAQKKKKDFVQKIPLGSVSETERELRDAMKFTAEEYIPYFQKLVENEEYETFFKVFEEMNAELKASFSVHDDEEFQHALEKKKGQKVAEEYRSLLQRVHIEKFAPVRQKEHMVLLVDSISTFYPKLQL